MAGTEAEEAAWEMATAETLRARGELAEAANWYRRAANHLMEAGDDERAISVAKLAAELAALDDAGRSGAQRSEKSLAPEEPAPRDSVPTLPPVSIEPRSKPASPARPGPPPPPAPPPPPPPASVRRTASKPDVAGASGSTTGRHKLPWQRNTPSPSKPAGAAVADDEAVTIALDLGKLKLTAAESAPASPDSPLAALVDEAVSDLARDAALPEDQRDPDVATTGRMPAVSPERAAEIDAIAARLPALPLFAEVTPDEVRVVARQASIMHFATGENLTEAGAPEGPMFVLVEGEAIIGVAGDELRHQSLVAGDFVGEISACFGGSRMSTVVANVGVEAIALAPSLVRWMMRSIPSFGTAVNEAIADRVRASVPHLAPIFRGLEPSERRAAFAAFELVEVEAGDELLAEGDVAPALFVVCAGEIEFYGGRVGAARPVRGRTGEVAGLASVHGREPCAGSVRAARKTLVARLERAKYAEWLARYGAIAQTVGDVGTPGRGVIC